jgi:hypothetical protein
MVAIINFVVTGNLVNKGFLFIFVISFLTSCIIIPPSKYKDNFIYSSFFEDNFGEADDVECGFLKHDIRVSTPYGVMIVAAHGRDSGYFFDFACYKHGTISMLWPRKRKTVKIDNMHITIPSVSEIAKDRYSPVEFFDNFTIKYCITLLDTRFLDYIIPGKTGLHFGRDGKLKSFVICKDWSYNDIRYDDGQEFIVKDDLIFPKIKEYKRSMLNTEDQALIENPW